MLDAAMRKLIDPPLTRAGMSLARVGISANGVTLFGGAVGLAAAVSIAAGHYWWGLALILVSRLADGLDGAVARANGPTDFGGYLDIAVDFLFYGAVPLGFVLANPPANAIPGALLLVSFYFNAASFLGYAVLAEKHGMKTERTGQKSLFYADGLMEGTETIGFFIAFCLWPQHFGWFAIIFAAATLYTAAARLFRAYREFDVQT